MVFVSTNPIKSSEDGRAHCRVCFRHTVIGTLFVKMIVIQRYICFTSSPRHNNKEYMRSCRTGHDIVVAE